jgi:hypothetical protein
LFKELDLKNKDNSYYYGMSEVTMKNNIKKIIYSVYDKINTSFFKQVPSLLEKYDSIPGSSSDPMGKTLWPRERKSKTAGDSWEFDTKLELRINAALDEHFRGDGSEGITSDVAESLKDILSKGLYTDIIKRPISKKIYRGMVFDKNDLKKFLGKNSTITLNNQTIEKEFKFIPHKSASSWTTKIQIARDWGYYNPEDFTIVLTANTSDNEFLLDCKDIYKFKFASEKKSEYEVIALGQYLILLSII